MQKLLYTILLFSVFTQAKYMDNYSCAECHDKIYDEFQLSMHSKGYFNDELHRKIADAVSTKTYDCAVCHMPMADNLADLVLGKARPNQANKTHSDAVSCYLCHTIATVKKSHRFNVNVFAKQAEDYKPTLYGRLEKPDDNDEHSSVKNPIYAKKVCTGCHSHKRNENNVTIFDAMDGQTDSQECIKCHMPNLPGGSEKMNKRARGHHVSHLFLGIHDVEFRKKGVDINVSTSNNEIKVTLTNKMGHPLIIQSARAKYLKIIVARDGKVLWKNYAKNPSEDTQGYFANSFKRDGKPIIIPATSTSGTSHNLGTKETRKLTYKVPNLQSGDKVSVGLYMRLAKISCAKAVKLDDKLPMKEELIKEIEQVVK
jgi:hypothetical protein